MKSCHFRKTHDGYIEVRTINNSERIDSIIGAVYEHNEGLKNASIRTDVKRYENSEGNNLWDSELVGNTGKLGQNGGIYKNQHGSNRNGSLEESTRDSRIKHSLRGDVDSQGHHLSKEQIEYFKDSKVVNENGNLLVVHHGTGETFTRFSRNMIYFSDNADVADSYARDGKEKMTGYLNITKPFVVDAIRLINIINPLIRVGFIYFIIKETIKAKGRNLFIYHLLSYRQPSLHSIKR